MRAAFTEWLMGLPEGFVTGLGLPYTAQHRLLGNGVVPQQATVALQPRGIWASLTCLLAGRLAGKLGVLRRA